MTEYEREAEKQKYKRKAATYANSSCRGGGGEREGGEDLEDGQWNEEKEKGQRTWRMVNGMVLLNCGSVEFLTTSVK